jgi:hypothetical protein
MAFVASSPAKIPANRPKRARPSASRDGPDTAQYGRVWPNEWPNGRLHHDIERLRGAPVTIEPGSGAPGGRASPCRRAQRTRSTAAADGVSLRVLRCLTALAHDRRSSSATDHGATSRSRKGASLPVLESARLANRVRALALSSSRAASSTSSVASATAPVRRNSSLDLRSHGSSQAGIRRLNSATSASAGGKQECAARARHDCRSARMHERDSGSVTAAFPGRRSAVGA